MIDIDSLENVPTDCGQAEVHRHPATVNFGQVNEASRGWDNEATMQVLLDQVRSNTRTVWSRSNPLSS